MASHLKPYAFSVRVPAERRNAVIERARIYGGLQDYVAMLIERDLEVPAGGNCSSCIYKMLMTDVMTSAAKYFSEGGGI